MKSFDFDWKCSKSQTKILSHFELIEKSCIEIDPKWLNRVQLNWFKVTVIFIFVPFPVDLKKIFKWKCIETANWMNCLQSFGFYENFELNQLIPMTLLLFPYPSTKTIVDNKRLFSLSWKNFMFNFEQNRTPIEKLKSIDSEAKIVPLQWH